jgi:gas vesicle protein
MENETQERKHHNSNIGDVLTGLLIGGLAGTITALLLAPQSGEETRRQIREKGIELRDRTAELVEDTMAQVRSSADRLGLEGREKYKELKQQGQDLAVEQLDRVSDAAQAGKKAIQSPSGAA